MKIIETIYEKQKKYGYINAINIFRKISGEDCFDYDLKLTLCEYPCWDEENQFNLIFRGIRNLKIGDIDNLLKVYMSIRIVSDKKMKI